MGFVSPKNLQLVKHIRLEVATGNPCKTDVLNYFVTGLKAEFLYYLKKWKPVAHGIWPFCQLLIGEWVFVFKRKLLRDITVILRMQSLGLSWMFLMEKHSIGRREL